MMTAEQLKGSILQLAMQGKLVEQRPEEGTGEELYKEIQIDKKKLIKEGSIKAGKRYNAISKEEIMFDIPETWVWTRLTDIVFNRGQKKPENTFSYIDIGSIDNVHQKLNDEDNIIEAENAPSRARKNVAIGDVIYSTVRPYLHNMCIIDRELSYEPIASTGFAVMTCHKGLYNKYLFYFLLSPDFDRYANDTENSKGVAYPAINDQKLYKALVPLPPLAEQKRIVAKIEELMPFVEQYATASIKLNTLNTSFPEMMKKSILQEAVQGKLVPQDPNDEPASVLLENSAAEKKRLFKEGKIKKQKPLPEITEDEIPFDIPESWEWCRVGDVFDHNTGKAMNSSAKQTNKEGSVRKFITTSNLYWNRFDLSTVKEMFFSDDELARCTATKKDILMCEGGAYFGRTAIWNYEYDICFQNHVHRLRSYVRIKEEFFYYLFYFYRTTGLMKSKGTAMPGLSSVALHGLIIPLPPLAEQERIVSKIEEILPFVEKSL